MNTDNESITKNAGPSNPTPKYGNQQNLNSDKNDQQMEKGKPVSGMNPPKPGEHDLSPEKKRYDLQGDGAKDIDRERHPEEQVLKQKDMKKDDLEVNHKPESV